MNSRAIGTRLWYVWMEHIFLSVDEHIGITGWRLGYSLLLLCWKNRLKVRLFIHFLTHTLSFSLLTCLDIWSKCSPISRLLPYHGELLLQFTTLSYRWWFVLSTESFDDNTIRWFNLVWDIYLIFLFYRHVPFYALDSYLSCHVCSVYALSRYANLSKMKPILLYRWWFVLSTELFDDNTKRWFNLVWDICFHTHPSTYFPFSHLIGIANKPIRVACRLSSAPSFFMVSNNLLQCYSPWLLSMMIRSFHWILWWQHHTLIQPCLRYLLPFSCLSSCPLFTS
mgnify:CR=1 FL=1